MHCTILCRPRQRYFAIFSPPTQTVLPTPGSLQGVKLSSVTHETMLEAKQLGYSDIQISQRMGTTENEVCNNEKSPVII